jgi:hypothetical protein
MGRLCTVCCLPPEKRQAVDAALLVHQVSYRAIASTFEVSELALQRHEQTHLRHSIQESRALSEMLSAENLLAKLGELDRETREMLTEARTQGKIQTALSAVRESRGNIEAFARIGPMSEVEQRLRALEAGQVRHEEGRYDDE